MTRYFEVVWPIMPGKPPLATHVRPGSRASQRGRIRKTFPSHLIPIGNDKRASDYPFSEAGSGSIQTVSIATTRLLAGNCIFALFPHAFQECPRTRNESLICRLGVTIF